MATFEQMMALQKEQEQAADAYIGDLLGQARGDYDFAIKQLKREHDLALGTNDSARAAFMERVADKLEENIGRIPYDYDVATTRTTEDLSRLREVTTRNKDIALQRLAQDEATWRENFGREADTARQGQQEELSARGLLQGTRGSAEGLASRDVGRLDTELSSTISAFDRALGRTREDVERQAGDTLFEGERSATRTQQDLTTAARRGAIDTQDQFRFGSEAAERTRAAREKELERLRAMEKLAARASSVQFS